MMSLVVRLMMTVSLVMSVLELELRGSVLILMSAVTSGSAMTVSSTVAIIPTV